MSFEYHQPTSVDEAVSLLQDHGDDAMALAGGSAFTLFMKLGLVSPGHVVGLGNLEEMGGIHLAPNGLWIGALSTHAEIEKSPTVRDHHRTIADMFARVATVRLRNQATLGGNIAHADPAQDPPPTLIALDARAVIAGPNGFRREAPLDGFFTDYFSVALEPGELILGVRVPLVAADTRATYMKFLPRSADDYATVGVAAVARVGHDGLVASSRVVLGAVGPTPMRAKRVEQALLGQRVTPQVLADAAALVRDEIDPIADARGSPDYKREMARVWTERALTAVTA